MPNAANSWGLLSEQHPREQGLKLFSQQGNVADEVFQSNIQENKDWNLTVTNPFLGSGKLSEQHPREQGLKLQGLRDGGTFDLLSEQHPREQGLKHKFSSDYNVIVWGFQSNIQENKDWNVTGSRSCPDAEANFQSNIQENKDWNCARRIRSRHRFAFQSNIQENKDWNSKRRIQNCNFRFFQSNIQENKDWNSKIRIPGLRYRPLSEQHPREQGLKLCFNADFCSVQKNFQSNIQENKDWNEASKGMTAWGAETFRATSKRTRIETNYKHRHKPYRQAFRATSKRTRIETRNFDKMLDEAKATFRATSKRTRIETCQ